MYKDLNPQKALIFRITHRDNVAWILDHGLHCPRSPTHDPNYVQIGNPELIDKRFSHLVQHQVGGTLGDYVPFYFTPFSMMLLNIKTGYNGIRKRANDEIVILASSLPRLKALRIPFLFTNIHAYMKPAVMLTLSISFGSMRRKRNSFKLSLLATTPSLFARHSKTPIL
jgi:hypothetical protein